MKKSKVEIIQETVDYYSADPSRRGYDSYARVCMYLTSDGKMCAVGRCLNEPKRLGDFEGDYHALVRHCDQEKITNLFKPEYEGHSEEFWQDLQDLHDTGVFWDKETISHCGKQKVNELIEKWTE